MKNSIAKFMLPCAAGLLLAGCAPERPVAVGPQVAGADNEYVGLPKQPPPPGLVAQWWFIPGHWVWRGQWVWVAGHWRSRPHSGDVWIVGKWVPQDDAYAWQKGHWRSGAHAGEESNGSD